MTKLQKVKKYNGYYKALCPAHNDHNPSLTVTPMPDGNIRLKCHAGCSSSNILKGLGLKISDLKPTSSRVLQPVEIIYDYRDENGVLKYQVVRRYPKNFKCRRPDGKGGATYNLHGIDRIPYRLPEVIKTAKEGGLIFVTEGEKDCDAAVALGFTATTNSGGAGKWNKRYARYFEGASEIAIFADKDMPGRAHAKQVAESLQGIVSVVKVLEVPGERNKDFADWCRDGITREDVLTYVESNKASPQITISNNPASDEFHLTDLGNARRLVRDHGENIRYCYARKRWLKWDVCSWRWDDGNLVLDLAKKTVLSLYELASRTTDDNERKATAAWAKRSEANDRLKAMVELAQSEPGMPIQLDMLDADPWLFNCRNGTIDLRTGQLKSHRREDMLTITAPVDYDSLAKGDLWQKFLDRITVSNKEMEGYLQRCAGYSLTGDIREQIVLFCYGVGSNGKSTFLCALRDVMGDYAMQADPDTFMLMRQPSKAGHKEDIAALKGKRLVAATEVEDGHKLSVVKIKQITGGERLRASRKYEHEAEFAPTHKIWLSGNYKPVITDTSYSIWRRIKLIPFTVVIPESEKDPVLPMKLKAEYPAILAWAVQGCLDWQKQGLVEPKLVTYATQEYRKEENPLSDFLQDSCQIDFSDTHLTVAKGDLYARYQAWANRNGAHPMTQKSFRRQLITIGVQEFSSGPHRKWRFIALITPEDALPDATDATGDAGFTGNYSHEENPQNITENTVALVTTVAQDTSVSSDNPTADQSGDITEGESPVSPSKPVESCPACGESRYWLRPKSEWGEAEWLCANCHPDPRESEAAK